MRAIPLTRATDRVASKLLTKQQLTDQRENGSAMLILQRLAESQVPQKRLRSHFWRA